MKYARTAAEGMDQLLYVRRAAKSMLLLCAAETPNLATKQDAAKLEVPTFRTQDYAFSMPLAYRAAL
jgi:hypothetical protein